MIERLKADLRPKDPDFDKDPRDGSPNAVPEALLPVFTAVARAWYDELTAGKPFSPHTEVVDAWLEAEDRVRIRVNRYHCSTCYGDWDNLQTFALPLAVFAAADPVQAARDVAAGVRAEREALEAREAAWKAARREQGEIQLLRRLMEKYPGYVDPNHPLPDLGPPPRPQPANVREMLCYSIDDPRP